MNGTTDDLSSFDVKERTQTIQNIIGTDKGDRGMKSLIVPGDLLAAGKIFANLSVPSTILVLSGFPCCVDQRPPTETDGPPGACAIARTGLALGHRVIVVTDDCNRSVFQAAGQSLPDLEIESFPERFDDDDEIRFQKLASCCDLLIACERAGPGKDGRCYTMRGIDMNAYGLIAPLHRFAESSHAIFIAIGDGGNELGMGKVMDAIVSNTKIADGAKIGCVIPADYLIAASISNWGAYALATSTALCYAVSQQNKDHHTSSANAIIKIYVEKCLPSEQHEIDLLQRCIEAGCRDGVTGRREATVDGMPLESSLECLRYIRKVALGEIVENEH
jgi:hypothetical protein